MDNNWQGIYEQSYAINFLDKVIKSLNIPHAFLFQGQDGIGKEFTAIRFAQNVYNSTNNNIDLTKISSYISNFTEPYFTYIFPLPRGKNETAKDGPFDKLKEDYIKDIQAELNKKKENPYYKIRLEKANNIKINSIRNIKKSLSINYEDIRYRIILISDAHLMNNEAQNALLKELEEPPAGTVFILTTSKPKSITDTIRSRCWTVNFSSLSIDSIKKILINNFNVENKLAENVSLFADGSVTQALYLIDNNFEELFEKTILILRYSFGRKYNSAFNEFAKYSTNTKIIELKILIKLILTWLTDLVRDKNDISEIFFSKHQITLEKFNSKFPKIKLNKIVALIDNLNSDIDKNLNLNLIISNIIFELGDLLKK